MVDFSELKLNSRESVYIQIAQYVKKKIVLKHIESGDILPSRRELAAMLEINPNTAQKAYKLMEEEGYVTTSGNIGSIVCVNDEIYSRIECELTREMVKGFIKSAKDVNLTFKEVFDLVSDLWDEV